MIFDNAIRVTQHFLHTSNDILRILKIAFQKSKNTIAFCIFFEKSPSCDGAFFAHV